jgi:hypothetical protein
VLTVKSECLWRLLVFGEEGLWRAVSEHVEHYHTERNHQGRGNNILFPDKPSGSGDIECRERLGGLRSSPFSSQESARIFGKAKVCFHISVYWHSALPQVARPLQRDGTPC